MYEATHVYFALQFKQYSKYLIEIIINNKDKVIINIAQSFLELHYAIE